MVKQCPPIQKTIALLSAEAKLHSDTRALSEPKVVTCLEQYLGEHPRIRAHVDAQAKVGAWSGANRHTETAEMWIQDVFECQEFVLESK